jgi:hypothetical protein
LRLIKAKLPEADYEDYAKALGLTNRFDASKHGDIRNTIEMGVGGAPVWWNPPGASETTLFDHIKGDDYVQILRYSNGTVYFLVFSW